MGFSTATWEGNVLKIKTTHLKEDYAARTALPLGPRGDAAAMRMNQKGRLFCYRAVINRSVEVKVKTLRASGYCPGDPLSSQPAVTAIAMGDQ